MAEQTAMAMAIDTPMAVDSDELRKRARNDDDNDQQQQQQQHTEQQQQHTQPITCAMCSSNHVKYRCPRCERITCSLACCLDHKKTFDCDGKRDRTKYVPIKQFTDADLSSDFFFLEEVARSTSSAARSRSEISASDARPVRHKKRKVAKTKQCEQATAARSINPHVASDWLTRFPAPWQLLVQHAAKRGVALTLLAPGMSKRVRNTSHMDARKDALFWRVEWCFPSADVAVSLAEVKASDAQTPFELLAQYLAKSPENAGIRGKLRKYAVADWRARVLLLLRREFTPASTPQYYRLDGHASLESNLKRKSVVEFPVIIVALREDAAQYPVAHDRIEIVGAADDDGDDDNDGSGNESHGESHDGEGDSEGDDGDDAPSHEQQSGEGGEDDAMRDDGGSDEVRHGERNNTAVDAGVAETETEAEAEDAVSRNALLQAFLDDESSVDDLLPSIAEADDELLMFGEDVDGVNFFGKPSLHSLSWTAAPFAEELAEQPRAS